MGRERKKGKERFIGVPYRVANSAPFANLRPPETKMLLDLLVQYNGHNNGNLSPTFSLLKDRGWTRGPLYRTLDALKEKGFLVVTRQGWKQRGCPTLVAITWLAIDECSVKYDDGIKPSNIPLGYWCKSPAVWKTPKA